MPTINFKRGDTFQLECTRVDSAGDPVSLSGLTITSQLRVVTYETIEVFVDDLTVTVTDASAGEFRLSAVPADTALWPVGKIQCDVQFVGGVTESTETFTINNILDITRAS